MTWPTIDRSAPPQREPAPTDPVRRMAAFGWRVVRADEKGAKAEKASAAWSGLSTTALEAETVEELEQKVIAFEVARVEAQLNRQGVTRM